MRKTASNQLTAGTHSGSSNFREKVKVFIPSYQAFMNSINGTPAYWEKFLFDSLVMMKQSRFPTFS